MVGHAQKDIIVEIRDATIRVYTILQYCSVTRCNIPYLIFDEVYHKRGNFHWVKHLQYPQYMEFRGNIFTVQGQGAIYVLTAFWETKLKDTNTEIHFCL